MLIIGAGETIRFVLKNSSPLPHDFTIGTQIVQQGRRAVMEEITEAGRLNEKPETTIPFDSPNAVLVYPGETKELVWKFTETRMLEFGCNVPGHYELGMKGHFTVETVQQTTSPLADAETHHDKMVVHQRAKLMPVVSVTLPATGTASVTAPEHNFDKLAGLGSTLLAGRTKPPAPAVSPAPKPARIRAKTGWQIQLGSHRSQRRASADWLGMTQRHADVLGGLKHRILRANLGTLGVFYRLRVGDFPNNRTALKTCMAIRSRGGECVAVPPER